MNQFGIYVAFCNLWLNTPDTTNTEKNTQKHNTVAYVDEQVTLLDEFRAGARARYANQVLGTHYLDALGGSTSFNFRNVCNNSHNSEGFTSEQLGKVGHLKASGYFEGLFS